MRIVLKPILGSLGFALFTALIFLAFAVIFPGIEVGPAMRVYAGFALVILGIGGLLVVYLLLDDDARGEARNGLRR